MTHAEPAWQPPTIEGFSLDPDLIRSIFRHARPLGHREAADELNLGFGFLYYALARMLRPRHVVVIGSGFGFSVVCFALGLRDNRKGEVSFVDPSYSVLTDGPIRIGTQVDIVVPWRDDMNVRVRIGDRVRAGETVLID